MEKVIEKTVFEALVNRVNNIEEMDNSTLWLLENNHETTKSLWRAINALEDLNDEVLPRLVEGGLLSEEALSKLRSAKWQIVQELEPLAHEALKAERKYLPLKAKECSRRLMDD